MSSCSWWGLPHRTRLPTGPQLPRSPQGPSALPPHLPGSSCWPDRSKLPESKEGRPQGAAWERQQGHINPRRCVVLKDTSAIHRQMRTIICLLLFHRFKVSVNHRNESCSVLHGPQGQAVVSWGGLRAGPGAGAMLLSLCPSGLSPGRQTLISTLGGQTR